MRIEETVLFLAVVALSLALVVVVVAPILRQKRSSSRLAVGGQAEPATPSLELAEGPRACPACHRQQPPEFRFCPFDGTPIRGSGALEVVDPSLVVIGEGGVPVLTLAGGKICPSCARRYRLDVAVCARDGSPLVAVN